MEKTTKRNIVVFTAVVALCGWIGVFIDTFIPGQEPGDTLGMLIWLISPLAAAILLRVFAGDGWRDAGFLPRLNGNMKWYALSLLVYPAVVFTVTLLGAAIGWTDVSHFDTPSFFAGFVGAFGFNFIIKFFEQSVWMGYLTSKLLKLKIKDAWLYILVGGVIWGFMWHLPYWLVFLPEETLYSVIPMGRWAFSLWGSIVMICWAVMYIEIYRMTKSIWPAVLCHTMEDAVLESLIHGGQIEIIHGREIIISPWIGAVSALLYLIIGLLIRRYRKTKENRSVAS